VREQVHVAEELQHEGRGRVVVDVVRRALLLDPAGVHDDHAVGHLHGLFLVVRDEDGRRVRLLVQPPQPDAQLRAYARVESHPTVHHLVSSVAGRVRPDVGLAQLLRATFPGGSITGAPKVRAMEVLAELEPHARGVYTGALGWIGDDGDFDLSVAIRTATLRGDRIVFPAGGGIVLDSDVDAEYREVWEKARGMWAAIERTALLSVPQR